MTQDELKAAWEAMAGLRPDGLSPDEYIAKAVEACNSRLEVYTNQLPLMMGMVRSCMLGSTPQDRIIADLAAFVCCTVHVHLARKVGIDVDGIVGPNTWRGLRGGIAKLMGSASVNRLSAAMSSSLGGTSGPYAVDGAA